MRVTRPEMKDPISIALEWVMIAEEAYELKPTQFTDEHVTMMSRYRAHYGDAPLVREFLLAVAAVEAMNQWQLVKEKMGT